MFLEIARQILYERDNAVREKVSLRAPFSRAAESNLLHGPDARLDERSPPKAVSASSNLAGSTIYGVEGEQQSHPAVYRKIARAALVDPAIFVDMG